MEQLADACQQGADARRSKKKKNINWVHPLFWEPDELSEKLGGKAMNWGNHRICKACWEGKEDQIPSNLLAWDSPGYHIKGCCGTGNSVERTPSQMQRHIKKLHEQLVPVKSEDLDEEPEDYDRDMADRATYDLVGQDLDTFTCLTRKGMRRFVQRLVPTKRLPGRKALKKSL